MTMLTIRKQKSNLNLYPDNRFTAVSVQIFLRKFKFIEETADTKKIENIDTKTIKCDRSDRTK